MASNSETGHAKNVANFQTLTNTVTDMGTIYQPSDAVIRPLALTSQLATCKAANSAVKGPLVAYNDAVSKRRALFKPLSKLITRLLSIFKGTKALKQEKDYAKTIADKIRGKANKPPKLENEDTHSTSQLSYTMRTDNFETFIVILSAEPTYTPAETELQVTTLQGLLADMNSANNTIDLAYRALKGARTARNTALYAEGAGLVDTAMAVKDYVKGAFGTSSSQYKEIKGLEFVQIGADPNA